VLSRSLKVAAIYFFSEGVIPLVQMTFGIGTPYGGFETESLAVKIVGYLRTGLIAVAFIVAGASILARRSWAPGVTYITLAVTTVFAGYEVAWRTAGGQPSGLAIGVSYAAVAAWYSLWAYLVYRHRGFLTGRR